MIELDGVHFSYDPGETPDVLRGVSLRIADGSHLAILGRNGSGKSSLARLLNGLLQPTRGRVRVDSLDPADPRDVAAVRRRVQMVFQNPENQQVGTTVFEDMAFGLATIGCPTTEMARRAGHALRLVGLEVPLDQDVTTLSGGQLQRLALASCLALEPEVLVLDEVTSMLDPEAARLVAGSLGGLRTARQLTIVQITHHLDEIEDADRAVLLHEGRIVADAPPAEIFARGDLLETCGLEAPYRWRRSSTRPAPGAELSVPAAEPSASSAGFLVPAAGQSATVTGLVAPAAGSVVPAEVAVVAVDRATVDYGRVGRRGRIRSPRRARRSVEVLHDVSVAVAPGELVAVAGRSGAGKSTFLSLVKGLVPPVRGAVLVDGVDPWRPRRPELFDTVGYVFQRPEHQLFAITVRADVGYGLTTSDLSEHERSARVDVVLARLGLDPEEVGERSPLALSGGQQRRVAIAGVLVTEPAVLVLDEPTAGLDHPSREALFEILHQVRVAGTAVLWVSHRYEEVLAHAGRLLVLDGGTIVADGAPARLLADPDLRARMAWPLLPQLDDAVGEGEALERWEASRA